MDYNGVLVSKTNFSMISGSRRASITRGNETVSIPSSTTSVIIVKAFDKPLPEPVATISTKSHYDEQFPLFLRDKVSEADFKYTIEGINWFADLLHDAEVEFYAERMALSDNWKNLHQALLKEEERVKMIVALAKAKAEDVPPLVHPRKRIATERDLKTFQTLVAHWLSNFLEDENNAIYLPKGVQWNSPETNNWKWLEIHVLPEAQKFEPRPVAVGRPQPPAFGNALKLSITGHIEIHDHTEYLIEIKTDMQAWYPYFNHRLLRRYNEFKQFYSALNADLERQNAGHKLPEIPEASYFSRKSKSTIEKRIKNFQELLDEISKQPICNHQFVFRFLGIEPSATSYRYRPYWRRSEDKDDSAAAATIAPDAAQ